MFHPNRVRTYLTIGLLPLLLATTIYASEVGRRFPSERKTFVDSLTGITVTALTTDPASDMKTYQTHPQWTHDGQYIVFRSNRTGSYQYFAYSEATGELIQLTQAPVGPVFLSRKEATMYTLQGKRNESPSLVATNIGALLGDSATGKVKKPSAYNKVIATFPKNTNQSGGFSLDANETHAYVGIRTTPNKTDTTYALQSVDLKTGAISTVIDLPFRIGHVQANPFKSGEILYCHETGGDAPQRMWLVNADGSNNHPLYQEAPTEWITHEVWVTEDYVFFNISGGQKPTDPRRLKPHGIASINVRTNEVMFHDQIPVASYWHCAATPDRRRAIGDSHKGDIYLIDLVNGGRKLLTAGHHPRGGPAHPHQNFSPDGQRVLFGSDYFGNADMMTISLPE